MVGKDVNITSENPLDLFLKIGLDERTAKNTVANKKVTANLIAVIHEAAVTDGCDRAIGNLLYTVATKFPANALVHRPTLLQYIVSLKIKTPAQLEAAFSFFATTGSENFKINELEEACGVVLPGTCIDQPTPLVKVLRSNLLILIPEIVQGDSSNGSFERVEVSEDDIKCTVTEIIEEHKSVILELRYRTNVGELFGHVRKRQPWADPKIVKQLVDANLYALLGERTAADDEKPIKKKKEKPVKVEECTTAVDTPPKPSEEELNPYLIFPSPEENYKFLNFSSGKSMQNLIGIVLTSYLIFELETTLVHTEIFFSDRPVLRPCNTREMLEKHLKATGGKVFTRFPPEPNGYLHIGHAKAMFINFGLAKERGGCCYLRYDDTNPEAEKKEYIDHIEEIVRWMGWEPFKITYASDYFQDLYELAVELIRRGHAYVDHQTPEEIKEYREKRMNSPWRDRPIEESLKLFDDMKRGIIEEGKATLRMKQDMQSDNYNMHDLIAYRIKASVPP
ncbi:hypothetical protein TEA_023988 [Camellia sinensis var. sinensis]|uniref:Glutaminyl-tRNA synthetase n=1 Tax=Camellia sinensis var. sinensis TaxID=542762 RepID=A0A4S4DXN9_CAMSN|nr:hypothetical protein TEA_023988 [Camellia sinensis var. sinensis]